MGWYGLHFSGLGWGLVEFFCEHDNETSGYIKFWGVLEQLGDWQVLRKGSAVRS
jgi:hypothetical protein